MNNFNHAIFLPCHEVSNTVVRQPGEKSGFHLPASLLLLALSLPNHPSSPLPTPTILLFLLEVTACLFSAPDATWAPFYSAAPFVLFI